jgi:hypothetical protein
MRWSLRPERHLTLANLGYPPNTNNLPSPLQGTLKVTALVLLDL